MDGIRYGRKKRGIKKELNKKITEWIESIDDEDVRSLAYRNTIVTGGSIASMLLGEPVNDFDVYFRDIDTAEAVSEYYVKAFNKAKEQKEAEKNKQQRASNEPLSVSYTPFVKRALYYKDSNTPLVDPYKHDRYEKEYESRMIKELDDDSALEQRLMIWMQSAGIAAEDQEDYQYFEMRSQGELENFADSLGGDLANTNKPKYRPVFLSQNAITLSDKVQLVIRFYGEPEQIHNNYDFAHAMNYYDYGNDELVLKQEALECLLSRTLIYRGSLYPVASVFRTKKFIERGWRITAGEQLKMMWQISELDLTDFNTIREQMCGVDMAYMYELVQALKSVDPEKINSSYIAAIIDRVFD
ncbi:MAG: hypothetical protein R3230_00915 [Nitrosopumilaceae archaeon]|nr:hypothetical protein [Nitrosopumilaceae archaeon]